MHAAQQHRQQQLQVKQKQKQQESCYFSAALASSSSCCFAISLLYCFTAAFALLPYVHAAQQHRQQQLGPHPLLHEGGIAPAGVTTKASYTIYIDIRPHTLVG